MHRRQFLRRTLGGTVATGMAAFAAGPAVREVRGEAGVFVTGVQPGEDLLTYIERTAGRFDNALYLRLLGAANEFKEGDEIVGVAAADQASRENARKLLSRTRVRDLVGHPPLHDSLFAFLEQSLDRDAAAQAERLTMGELKDFLLTQSEMSIKSLMPGLSSDVIGCVVKLMTNEELTSVGAKVFNPLPGTQIGARGYLGARIQPNSPTDHVDDILWQVLDGFAYAVGDVLLGTNPVSSDPESVHAVELTLQEILKTFELQEVLPHCVLAHIDVQAEVEDRWPGSTALWFQSIAGSDSANATFDVTLDKILGHASRRTGQFGLYFETGQGADFTNGHGHGYDMVLHESRKYGFARALTQEVAKAQQRAGTPFQPWVHVNDVAGFIGPEVFRNREQLVRCCLEDIVMGKLHGLCIGLDVCSTLHMEVSLDDLDWCLDAVTPACPAYLMALPTKIDPMLGYLTTGYQDHVRLRQKFGARVNDAMARFFQELGILDSQMRPTEHYGDPLWVWLKYCRRKGDSRPDDDLLNEGRQKIAEVRSRGVFLAEGYGANPWDLAPRTDKAIRTIYSDAKKSIWAELTAEFIESVPQSVPLKSRSADRTDYILHPTSGERLSESSISQLEMLRLRYAGQYDVQIVVSDGLNAQSIMDSGHLDPFLNRLRSRLKEEGYKTAAEVPVITYGRVRAGYQLGETLFSGLAGRRTVIHVIGERPGTGHHTFSVYFTSTDGTTWSTPGQVDHNLTKVVSGIANTALPPISAADEVVRILKGIAP